MKNPIYFTNGPAWQINRNPNPSTPVFDRAREIINNHQQDYHPVLNPDWQANLKKLAAHLFETKDFETQYGVEKFEQVVNEAHKTLFNQ